MKSIPENVLTLFFDTYQKQPTTIAVSDGHVKFSYAELEAASYGIARRLASLGASPGDVIPIVTQSCLQMVIGVLGILRTGATYAPLDSTQWPTSKMQATVARLHPKILLYTGKINVEFEPDVVSISVEEILGTLVDTNDSVHGAYISLPLPGGLACIIFTSGTTGEPKGVMLRHSSLHHFVTSPPFNYNVTCHDSVLLVLSCAFDGMCKCPLPICKSKIGLKITNSMHGNNVQHLVQRRVRRHCRWFQPPRTREDMHRLCGHTFYLELLGTTKVYR